MSVTAETMNKPTPADYRSGIKPIWCPGCGDYSVLLEITKALAALELPSEEVAIISGIGCSSRIPAYSSSRVSSASGAAPSASKWVRASCRSAAPSLGRP